MDGWEDVVGDAGDGRDGELRRMIKEEVRFVFFKDLLSLIVGTLGQGAVVGGVGRGGDGQQGAL